jgi:hypothetical protein
MRRIASFRRLARSLSSSAGGVPLVELRAQIKLMREKTPPKVEIAFVNEVLSAILHEYKAETAQAAAAVKTTEGAVEAEGSEVGELLLEGV